MLSEVRRSPRGPYLDVGHLFPEGLFAYVTLAGFGGVSPDDLALFLIERGWPGVTVHRVDQVHSATVVDAVEAPCRADAVVGGARGEAVRVVTADCVPILLATADGSRVAAVHAGWKGTLARIVQGAAARLEPARRGGLVAYLGPAIGPCCYTVDADRHALFRAAFPGWIGAPGARDRAVLDLQRINGRLLEEAGVPEAAIHAEERCTACGVGLCCSYRRDGESAGRMAALIGRSP